MFVMNPLHGAANLGASLTVQGDYRCCVSFSRP